jgi:hypothetical protein
MYVCFVSHVPNKSSINPGIAQNLADTRYANQAFTANRSHVFIRIISGRIVLGTVDMDMDVKCGRSGLIIGR